MKINFIGNFQNGYVGEVGDATHLAREMETLGHTVRLIPQDEWREYVREYPDGQYKNVPTDLKADINIICKWHHFYDGSFIEKLRELSNAPVFYWVWDYMWDGGIPEWHKFMAQEADLYLTNEGGIKQWYEEEGVSRLYYFPFDVADGEIPVVKTTNKDIDVAFFGSWIGQGDRQQWLPQIHKTNPITVFSWNYKDWPKEFNAQPAVYGNEFAYMVARCKIILGFSVEPHCWGYWSNRVGKIMSLGGFLLYQYAPGMELFLRDGVEYFSSIEEAREKIDHYLIADDERESIAKQGYQIGRNRFTSQERVKDLMILCDRFIKKGDAEWLII